MAVNPNIINGKVVREGYCYADGEGDLAGGIVSGLGSITSGAINLATVKKQLEAQKQANKIADKQLTAQQKQAQSDYKLAKLIYETQKLNAQKEIRLAGETQKIIIPILVITGLVVATGIGGYLIYKKRTTTV